MSLLALLLIHGPARSEGTSGRVRVQVGQEVDTNVQRTYSSGIADGLARIVIMGQLQLDLGSHDIFFRYDGGAKLFYSQSSENELVNQLSANYAFQFSPDWSLGSRLTFHDTSLEVHDRDYLMLLGELFSRTSLAPGWAFEVFLGGRYFHFKPDEESNTHLKFSHAGPLAGARFYFQANPEVSAVFFYQIGPRFFGQKAWEQIEGTTRLGNVDRLDIRHEAGLRIKHSIRYFEKRMLILEALYLIAFNDSNSYGSGALWHRLQLIASMQLPLEISLHLMGTLQFTDYPDGVYVEGDLYEPDADENENSVVLRLSRPLWNGLTLILQGGLYRNDFNSQEFDIPSFQRETVMLGLSYDLPF